MWCAAQPVALHRKQAPIASHFDPRSQKPTPAPHCPPGPRGRRGDQVGGFTLMNVADLRRVAPLWLKYTEDVRFDPDVRPAGWLSGAGKWGLK